MFYVYGEYDPGCSCCSCSYHFAEFNTEEEAQKNAADYKLDGYSMTILKGEEIPMNPSYLEKMKEEKKKKEEEEEKAFEEEYQKNEREEWERLNKKYGQK